MFGGGGGGVVDEGEWVSKCVGLPSYIVSSLSLFLVVVVVFGSFYCLRVSCLEDY